MVEKKEEEQKEHPPEDRESGDWGNPGRWGTFSNRPNFYREEVRREEPEEAEKEEE